ncbi:MAG: glycosyltransferase [Bacteroidaceae bacterium]|nr:glycosyltransferase [Bacteroidaceae bacterium]
MNIAYILHSTASNAGANKALMNMLGGLLPYGIHPFAVVPDGEGITQELKKRDIPTLIINYRSSAYPHSHTMKEKLLFLPRLGARIFVNQRATRAVKGFLKENRIDIVHSNSGVVRIGFDAAQKVGVPHIYHIREYGDLDFGVRYFPNREAFLRQLKMPNNYTICITKDVQRHQQLSGVATSRVIYDGVFPALSKMSVGTEKDYFLYAGRIEPAKGLDQLLLAYKRYVEQTDSPIPLKVAGACGQLPYYRQQVEYVNEQGLAHLVEFVGEYNDIAFLMWQARALVIPSRNEGFGFCMPEAMQQGCLCIARNTGGTKEQLDNALQMMGEEIALRYDTVEQLTECLHQVGNHAPDDYASCTERAFKVVNRLYTKDVHAKNVYEFYQEIIGK